MTEAERSLWRILRSRQIEGHKFRRQVPLGRYIADFVCHEGYRILRFWNNDVLSNIDGVQEAIAEDLRGYHPHPALPHRGGGF
jgi:very-short-patch-repair endonuclease